MSRAELTREKVIRSGSPLRHHSLNQKIIKDEASGVRKLSPLSKNIERALEKRFRLQTEIGYSTERGKRYIQNNQPLTPEYKFYLRRHGVEVD